jgi:tetratricopeptide (TPR) repeat protein
VFFVKFEIVVGMGMHFGSNINDARTRNFRPHPKFSTVRTCTRRFTTSHFGSRRDQIPIMAVSEAPYYDLGAYHRSVSTKSSKAQIWFNRGLVWTYAFNHEEAVECFEQAIRAVPGCAMAYFGLAYALGPNYNKPWDFFDTCSR